MVVLILVMTILIVVLLNLIVAGVLARLGPSEVLASTVLRFFCIALRIRSLDLLCGLLLVGYVFLL